MRLGSVATFTGCEKLVPPSADRAQKISSPLPKTQYTWAPSLACRGCRPSAMAVLGSAPIAAEATLKHTAASAKAFIRVSFLYDDFFSDGLPAYRQAIDAACTPAADDRCNAQN
jgi:hypothetical protein